MLRLVLIAGVAGLLASAAVAQPTAAGAGSEPAGNPSATTADSSSADNDPTKVICKNVKPPTGTRLASSRNRQRVCQTRADWEQQEREAQEALKVRDRGTCSNGACAG